jgi:ribosomal protein S12 methylthiotransferase accessory factor YcaO
MPTENLDFEDALEYIQDHPNDDFMHKYLLDLAGTFGPNLTRQLIERGKNDNPHLMTLMYEACILNDRLHALLEDFDGTDTVELAQYTPLIYLNWSVKKGREDKAYWLKLFSENILLHKPAKPQKDLEFPIPFDQEAIAAWQSGVIPITELSHKTGQETSHKVTRKPDTVKTYTRAIERLKAIDFKTGPETKNLGTLSPFALQMQWPLEISVSTGRNQWQMTGLQTSYGKGLDIDQARASCLMEVLERISAFASFDHKKALHYKHGHSLVKARYEDLKKEPYEVLDPNDMHLEVPYQNQPLYWVSGERVDENGAHPIYVPAQLVFLFCNLDEICLTSGLPSTGLASGNTLEEAKLHSLLEVIERDAERLMPYSRKSCFLLESDYPPVQDILQRSKNDGVHVQFLDITSEFGIPCYKAFIQGPGGEILKGCAAHLDGKRAVVSALTELPFHDSWFRPVPIPDGLSPGVIRYDDLPDYASGDTDRDLALLERLLVMNGYRPIYVNLTRKDLGIPTVKTLIPGLEIFAEFDRFSALSLRQFAHYHRVWK